MYVGVQTATGNDTYCAESLRACINCGVHFKKFVFGFTSNYMHNCIKLWAYLLVHTDG